jgi:hypothetical protein
MTRHTLRWAIGPLVASLALVGGVNSANAGFVAFPTDPGTLLADFTAFVNDFGSWNAQQNNMPMMLLANTPSSQQGEAIILLWWWWMQDGGLSNGSPNPVTGNGNGNGLNFPPPFPGGGGTTGTGPTPPGGNGGGGGIIPSGGGSGGGVSPHVGGAPAPSALTLSCTGLAGLLIYGCARRRLGRSKSAPVSA